MRRTIRLPIRCALLLAAACTPPEDPAPSVWFALDAPDVDGIRERTLVPLARLHPDGSWDLPWPRPRRVSWGFPEQASLIPVGRDGFLRPPPGDSGDLPRPGVHWLLPYATADSARLRSVAPVRWFRYAAGETLQAQRSVAERMVASDHWRCSFWVLDNSADYGDGASPGLALSIPALRPLSEDEIEGLDEALTEAGLPHQPSDDEGGYDFRGFQDPRSDSHPHADRYPQRGIVGLARVREGLDVALVRLAEAGPRFDATLRPVTTWALVELRDGRARIVSRFSPNDALCAGRPAQQWTGPLWMALTSDDGAQLNPLARRLADGSWDPAWPERLSSMEMDRGGFLHHWRNRAGDPESPPEHWPLPFRSVDGERARLELPLLWYRHSRRGMAPGTVTDLVLASRRCDAGWSLRMDPGSGLRGIAGPRPGIAFSDPAATRLGEETPELAQVRNRLGLIDQPTSRAEGGYRMGGSWHPTREVIGYFRLADGTVLGVVQVYHYEGEATMAFEIPAALAQGEGTPAAASDTARIVLDVSAGGC